ncbi:hypothetical protein [Actinomadura sp. 9N407]|uniref:hypothetical protein n=1 Tax=Actinomadura sp. 9N407 TaxID=3375154 RepID=UPI0037ACFE53
MMKRLAATGVLAMAVGGALLGATPALAHGGDEVENQEVKNEQGLGIQICQLPIIPIISPVEMDDCYNGSTEVEQNESEGE